MTILPTESWFRRAPVVRVLSFAAALLASCEANCTGPNATVTGNVTMDGVPAAGIPVRVESRSGREWNGTTDANGNYSIPIQSGVKHVYVNLPPDQVDCLPEDVELEIRSDETKIANFACVDKGPYTATVTAGYNHSTGIPGQSVECKLITTNPKRPGATYTMDVSGPIGNQPPSGVVGPTSFSGTLDADGTARITVPINRFGTYHNSITITSKGGVVRSGEFDVPVSATASQCPFAGP